MNEVIAGIRMRNHHPGGRCTGLMVCTNDRYKAQAGAVWFNGYCVRCAPILKRHLMCYGKQTQMHHINFNWFTRLGWVSRFYPADMK